MNLDTIIQALPQLSRDELLAIRQKINSVLSVTVGSEPAANAKTEILLTAIVNVFSSHGMNVSYPALSRRTKLVSMLEEKSGVVCSFLQIGQKQLNIVRGLMELSFDLLYQDMVKHTRIPVTPQVLIQNLDRVPAVVNKHFPGYAEAGLLDWIIREQLEQRV